MEDIMDLRAKLEQANKDRRDILELMDRHMYDDDNQFYYNELKVQLQKVDRVIASLNAKILQAQNEQSPRR